METQCAFALFFRSGGRRRRRRNGSLFSRGETGWWILEWLTTQLHSLSLSSLLSTPSKILWTSVTNSRVNQVSQWEREAIFRRTTTDFASLLARFGKMGSLCFSPLALLQLFYCLSQVKYSLSWTPAVGEFPQHSDRHQDPHFWTHIASNFILISWINLAFFAPADVTICSF